MLNNTFFWKLHVFKIIIFSISQFNFIFRKKLEKASTNVLSKLLINVTLHTVEIFFNLILRNHRTWTWKILDCFNGLKLTLWYIGLTLKKYFNYLTDIGLILWHIGVRLEKYLDYLGFGLILWYIGLGIEKH